MNSNEPSPSFRFLPWFLASWSWTTLPLAAVLLLLSPLLYASLDWVGLFVFWQWPAYLVHQYEEHAQGRFVAYVNGRICGGLPGLDAPSTLVINIVGVWAVMMVAIYGFVMLDPAWGLVAIYLTLVNGVIHVIPMIVTRQPNPGVWTSLLLFLPLGSAGWAMLIQREDPWAASHLLAAGFVIALHIAIVAWIRLRLTKLRRDRSQGEVQHT